MQKLALFASQSLHLKRTKKVETAEKSSWTWVCATPKSWLKNTTLGCAMANNCISFLVDAFHCNIGCMKLFFLCDDFPC